MLIDSTMSLGYIQKTYLVKVDTYGISIQVTMLYALTCWSGGYIVFNYKWIYQLIISNCVTFAYIIEWVGYNFRWWQIFVLPTSGVAQIGQFIFWFTNCITRIFNLIYFKSSVWCNRYWVCVGGANTWICCHGFAFASDNERWHLICNCWLCTYNT